MLLQYLGKKKNPGLQPNNVPYVVLGASILWFGWFGFNGGSALASDSYANNAMLVTQIAAATAATTGIVGLLLEVNKCRRSCNRVAAGLVAITPAAGAVNALETGIGFGAGFLCYYAVELIHKTNLEDALDVFAVHGIGIWGCIATGIFAVESIAGVKGLSKAVVNKFGSTYTAAGTLAYSFVVSFAILFVLDDSWIRTKSL